MIGLLNTFFGAKLERRVCINKLKQLVLQDAYLKEGLKDAAAELITGMIDSFFENRLCDFSLSLGDLIDGLHKKLNFRLVVDKHSYELFDAALLRERIVRELEYKIEEREKIVGPDNLNSFIRDIYLHIIEEHQADHLTAFEELAAQTRQEAASRFFLMPIDLFWKYNACFRLV
jgi:preprotein translocase subunit SecA